jgi:hypothetical protein
MLHGKFLKPIKEKIRRNRMKQREAEKIGTNPLPSSNGRASLGMIVGISLALLKSGVLVYWT